MSPASKNLRTTLIGAALLVMAAAAGALAQTPRPTTPAPAAPVAPAAPTLPGPAPLGVFQAPGAQSTPAPAPPVTPAHLAAAVEAVAASKVAKGVENVLPSIAQQVESVLTRARPELAKQIGEAVDDMALKMVGRRAEIDADIVRIWTKYFTEAELKAITAFYRTPTGAKLADAMAPLTNESLQAVNLWSSRLASALLEDTRAELKRRGINL